LPRNGLLGGIRLFRPGTSKPTTFLARSVRSAIHDFIRYQSAEKCKRRREPPRVSLEIARPVAKSKQPDSDDEWKFLGQGLSKRQSEILRRYYRDGATHKEIGLALDISQSRAWQMRAEALELLRERFKGREEKLFEALGVRAGG